MRVGGDILRNYLARLAVPFFFITGGYLCFRRTSAETFDYKLPWMYAKRLYKLYLIWTGIYLPQIFYQVVLNESSILQGLGNCLRMIIFEGYGHLWYLYAAAAATTMVAFLLNRRMKIERIVVCGFLLYIIGVLGETYFGLLSSFENYPLIWSMMKAYQCVFSTTRNGLFEGVLFVSIGVLFAYKKIEMREFIAGSGFFVSMSLMFVEACVVEYFEMARGHDMYICLVSSVFFLFYIILSYICE